MARSAEKAMTALARWRAAYVLKLQDDKRRPYHTIDCQDAKDAMQFRRQIVHELTKKITQIQNPSLGEYKLRDLNDEINKLIKEKNHWESRIKELGGPDYAADAPKLLEKDGKEAPGYRGYRYFGAARDLPGVRELFEDEPQPPPRKTRGELMKNVDISYYGNCDEDDGIIVSQERDYEKLVIKNKIQSYKKKRLEDAKSTHRLKRKYEEKDQDIDDIHQDDQNIYDTEENPIDQELARLYSETTFDQNGDEPHAKMTKFDLLSTVSEDLAANSASANASKAISNVPSSLPHAFVAHVPVKTQAEMEELLVEQRKKQLLSQYMSDDLLATVSRTSDLLGHGDNKEKRINYSFEEEQPKRKEVANSKTIDPIEAVNHHPLYDDSADEDEDNDEVYDDDD